MAGVPDGAIQEVVKLVGNASLSTDEARRLMPPYLEALERLTQYTDQWRPSPAAGAEPAAGPGSL
jgi:hypothetical protein